MSLHILFLMPRRTRIICEQTGPLVSNHRVFQVINPRLIDDTTEIHPRVVDMAIQYTVPVIDQNCYKGTSTILGVVAEVFSRFVLELLHRCFHDSLYLLQRYFNYALDLLHWYFHDSLICYRGTS